MSNVYEVVRKGYGWDECYEVVHRYVGYHVHQVPAFLGFYLRLVLL